MRRQTGKEPVGSSALSSLFEIDIWSAKISHEILELYLMRSMVKL